MNQQMLEGQWTQIKGAIEEKWGELSGDDLDRFEGNVDQLVGYISQKTGESREAIENTIEDICCSSGSTAQQVADRAQEYAKQAAAALNDQSEHVAEAVREGYHQAEEMVRKRPAESLAVIFGTGLVAGVIVGALLTRR